LPICGRATCSWSGSSTGSGARSRTLIRIIDELKGRGVAFRCLTEAIDTTTAHGVFLFNLFGSLAEYERALIKERVAAGLAAARRRGRKGGRPPAIDPAFRERSKRAGLDR